jgi:hypothetical protein
MEVSHDTTWRIGDRRAGALSLLAPNSQAAAFAPSPNPVDGGIFLYERDAPAPPAGGKVGVVGLGYEVTGPWARSAHWRWNASIAYGIGDTKNNVTIDTVATMFENQITSWEARLGWDYCEGNWYCGPGVVYLSTKQKLKQSGTPDSELEPFKVVAFEPRIGGSFKLSPRITMFASSSLLIGYGKSDNTVGVFPRLEEDVSGWFTSSAWHGGIRWMYR